MFRWGIVDDKPKLWKAQFIRDLRGRSYCEPPFSLSLSSQIIVSLFFHFHLIKSYFASELDDMSEDLVVSIFDENNDIEQENLLLGKVLTLD